jgi:hypothetical protein
MTMKLSKKLITSLWVIFLFCYGGNAMAVSSEKYWTESEASVINAGLNDAWYDPETNGQGFFITVFPDLGKVSLAWFTYDTDFPPIGATANLGDPGHRWLTAVGSIQGNQVLMDIEMTSGGIFDTPTEIQSTDPPGSDGTIILTFDSCNSGTVEYDIPSINRQGIVPIQRVANDNIVLCLALGTAVLPSGSCYISEGEVPTVFNPLFAVWGSGNNDVFAVGGSATILHYNGANWTPMTWGGNFGFEGVWGSSGSDVYAVGGFDGFGLALGIILHYDGNCWRQVFSTTDFQFTNVWGNNSHDVFATTSRGPIFHYDGTSWTPMKSGTEAMDSSRGVWGTGANDVYALEGGDIWRYDGSSWQLMASVNANSLRRAWGSSATNIYAVGANYTPAQTEAAVWKYDGASWKFVPSDTEGMRWDVWGSGPNNVFTVGDVLGKGLISNYNGTDWTTMLVTLTPTLQGVWGSSENDIFAVGGGARNGFCCSGEGTILHFDGSAWHIVMEYGKFR